MWAKEQPRATHFEKIAPQFADPGKDYRPAPLWVWNTRVTTADIDRMLGELKDAGFGGAFVHPRPGMITDYLSDDWFSLYRYSVDKGKELGLDIWIYDENSYPSGFAGGHVPAEMPESYNQGQGLAFEKASALPDDTSAYFMCLKKDGDRFTDISADTAAYRGVPGEYYLYKKSYYGRSDWHGGFSYVDLLYPGVTEKFLEVTMKGYEKTFGKELGTVIKGLFSDEPNIGNIAGIRWTPDFFDIFEKQWGYDLRDYLPLLVEETGDWKRVRHNYMETLTQLFIDRWSKPMSKYCEKKNLKWTGHYWEHGWPSVADGGDNMAMYAWHQLPAIDMLFNQYNDAHPQAQFGNARAVKELSSVANQMGRVRTLSETYGGGGWDETFEDLKRLGDWEYALGVNFLNQHLSHMTIVGARKYDYPPVFTSLSPWWNDYKTQTDYFGRLSLVLSQGHQINDVLVIEPTTSTWMYFSYVSSNPGMMDIGFKFQNFVTELEKRQAEYDLGSENIIKDHGRVRKGKFTVGERSYGTVVLAPGTENINSATYALLKEFVAGGGRLAAFAIPTLVDGKESPEAADFFRKNAVRYDALSDKAVADVFPSEKIRFDRRSGNDLYHHRRTFADGELVFLVNSSLTDSATGRVSIAGKSLRELDAMTGATYSRPATAADGMVTTDYVIPPAGSLLLFASATPAKTAYPERPVLEGGKELKAKTPVRAHRLKDNALILDFCDLTIDGNTEHNLYTVEACNKLYGHYGMPDPWNSAIQYRQRVVERDTFKTGDIRVKYEFIVGGDVDSKSLKVIAEQPDIWKVKINGTPVESEGASFLDSRFGVYPAGRIVKEGVNTVELSVEPMSIYAEIAPVYLTGNFALEPASHGWVVTKNPGALTTGSWKDHGMPCYSWDVAYSKTYTIADPAKTHYLRLNDWKGTVAQVWVNGKKAGTVAYKPYTFDLTPYLRKGDNDIEVRVTGSLHNLFGPHYNRDMGINGPWHWNGVQRQLPGSKYNIEDYGLINDFSVYSK